MTALEKPWVDMTQVILVTLTFRLKGAGPRERQKECGILDLWTLFLLV